MAHHYPNLNGILTTALLVVCAHALNPFAAFAQSQPAAATATAGGAGGSAAATGAAAGASTSAAKPATAAPAPAPAAPITDANGNLLPITGDLIVSAINYRFDGARKINPDEAAAHLRLKVGKPYTQDAADASIRAYYSTSLYEFVSIEPEILPDNTVRVNVTLAPRLRVTDVAFEGNKEWDAENVWSTGLKEEILVQPGYPLDEVLVARSVTKLREKYKNKFPFAEITPRIERDETKGTAKVTFVIKENKNIAIRRIEFTGNEHIAASDLRPVIDTSSWAWTFDFADYSNKRFMKFSWLTDWGRFDKEAFDEDIKKLREFYRNQGFLDVEIPADGVSIRHVETTADEDWLVIKITIKEGRRYTVGDIKFEGNTLGAPRLGETAGALPPARAAEVRRYNSDNLRAQLAQNRRDFHRPYPIGDRILDTLFPGNAKARNASEVRTNFDTLRTGDWYSPKAVATASEKIRDYYGQEGFLNTYAVIKREPDAKTGKINLVVQIKEGVKTHIGAINISGNTKTRDNVIIRELVLAPGEVFDTVRMKNSEMILRNTRFFESVLLSPEVTNANVPNVRDLRIDLREGQTGQLQFGVGFSSVEQLFGYAEYSESNFDIFNWRTKFRGGGQKFRVRVQIGTLSSSAEHSFENPWVGGRELAMGYLAYYRNDQYSSSEYEVQRIGLNIYARRRIYGQFNGSLDYEISQVRLNNVATTIPFIYAENNDPKIVSKVGFTVSRNTLNDFYFPTSGTYISFANYLAGGPFGGDVNYFRTELRTSVCIPIFDAAEQTLQLFGRVGSMVPYGMGDRKIPFYELFNLGGAYDLRGFKYNHVGPFMEDEAMGGKSYAMFTAEYTIKLFEQMRFAIFYDCGFLNERAFDFRARGSNKTKTKYYPQFAGTSLESASYTTGRFNDDAGFGFRLLVMGALMRIDVAWPLTSTKENNDGIRFNFSFGVKY
ncbi:MAG: BamA/TamA family outer membrane protein [Puniceicoccales bacterium]|jgi:outer membrane protein insertion porin family|nr:BamA/TamA family outer membrane protein [Puniceicoccales bacterium]